MRAAFLRPWGLLVVVIGLVFFTTTLVWWVVPLTLATYAALVLLAARDPLLKSRTLERWESQSRTQLGSPRDRDISPERRARWLPRGETRRKVEAALEIYQRTMVAIEESGDVARTVLDDTVPKLRRIAERLVDIAEKREKAADAIRELGSIYTSPRQREGRDVDLGELKEEIRAADAEISHILKQLTILQMRLVRLSVESRGKVRDAVANVSTDLDEMNLRLEALHSTVSPPRPPDR
jgi:flagellar motility protein MotE (MotC chaperone)